MVITNHNMNLGQVAERAGRAGNLLRGLFVFAGVVLCLAAFGLWLVPANLSGPDAIPIRAALTFLFIGVGFLLFRMGRQDGREELAIDFNAGRLLYMERGADGIARLRGSFDLAELDSLDAKGNRLIAHAHGGEVLRVALAGNIPDAACNRIAECFGAARA
ncbi:hypothetical protein TG4357_00437 [Thalassovita gelatinovora]|uniref:Integral membrane protein n=1 Tax=Thalassovita gelatinovora TaxID=53501 RepID=A0A0N7LUB4_THAGE|nr:hypothetical protein [Thalassovita gelatinovora]QIZ79557.1 hypothetical protein HFZ77_03220 [Thalassovita gelatinovora]CUH63026.1 hypothetical protein TG4357_00437 [Thalassovita gelatinovora]SEQ14448.1 hypothetical protein SAMN04488043_103337 [Thalassovita gelatinovora]